MEVFCCSVYLDARDAFVIFIIFTCFDSGIYTRASDKHKHCRNTVSSFVDSTWNVMAHGDAREEKWRGNWRMKWVASTLHTNSEHGVSSITTADAHTSAVSSRLKWHPRRFKWTRPFRLKTKSGFCTCAFTFQLASTSKSPHCCHV